MLSQYYAHPHPPRPSPDTTLPPHASVAQYENPANHAMRLLHEEDSLRQLLDAYDTYFANELVVDDFATTDMGANLDNCTRPFEPTWLWQTRVLTLRFMTDYLMGRLKLS